VTVAAIAPLEVPSSPSGEATIALDAVHLGPSLRAAGIDPSHVAALAEVPTSWPPILVNRANRSVVDGQHRIAAARQLGMRELKVTWFDGSPDDTYFEFVRRNVVHGLPLTLAERRAAARHMLKSQRRRSDRAIASVCGVSPTTVARLRKELGSDALANRPQDATGRVGLDGRVRPLNGQALRARIADEIALRPDASLRAIASVVHASPETVRSVRNELRARRRPTAGSPGEYSEAGRGNEELSRSSLGVSPRNDRAFADREGGGEFIAWFEATAVEKLDPCTHIAAVPLSRIYEIADIARRRGEFWTQFAEALETRARRWG